MKAEELMVGDWVMPLRKSIRKPCQVVSIDGGTNTCWIDSDEYSGLLSCSEVERIPLTPEILEKNRFKSWKYGYIWKERVGMGGQTTSASSPIEIIIYEDGHSVIMNPHEGKEFQGSIDSFHELQHALRLCGIDKEIVV